MKEEAEEDNPDLETLVKVEEDVLLRETVDKSAEALKKGTS